MREFSRLASPAARRVLTRSKTAGRSKRERNRTYRRALTWCTEQARAFEVVTLDVVATVDLINSSMFSLHGLATPNATVTGVLVQGSSPPLQTVDTASDAFGHFQLLLRDVPTGESRLEVSASKLLMYPAPTATVTVRRTDRCTARDHLTRIEAALNELEGSAPIATSRVFDDVAALRRAATELASTAGTGTGETSELTQLSAHILQYLGHLFPYTTGGANEEWVTPLTRAISIYRGHWCIESSTTPGSRHATDGTAVTPLDAVIAELDSRGFPYLGDCATAQVERDRGRWCSTLRNDGPDQKLYLIGRAFSDDGYDITVARRGSAWVVITVTAMGPP